MLEVDGIAFDADDSPNELHFSGLFFLFVHCGINSNTLASNFESE